MVLGNSLTAASKSGMVLSRPHHLKVEGNSSGSKISEDQATNNVVECNDLNLQTANEATEIGTSTVERDSLTVV